VQSAGLTVGVITHDRSTLFSNLLIHLKVAIEYCHSKQLDFGQCEVLIVNNSGSATRDKVQRIIDESTIANTCAVKVIDSPENNIALARNLIMDNAQSRWLVFVDDDEYPVPEWLVALYEQQQISGSAVVAGPQHG